MASVVQEMGDTAAAGLPLLALSEELARARDPLPLKLRIVQLIRKVDDVVRDLCRGPGA